MRHLFFIISILVVLNNQAQSSKIETNIKNIDNSQFIIHHNKPASFSMNSKAAQKLIKIGKRSSEKLIIALNDSSKVIMAQLVLCHIWFKHVSFAGPKVLVTDDGDIIKYYLGEEKGEGLLISEIKNSDNTYKKYVEQKELEKIKIYWNKKIITTK